MILNYNNNKKNKFTHGEHVKRTAHGCRRTTASV